ncbi:FAD-dependent oxidoreductase [Xylophilus sp. GOD-11R]|uniref:FAD-dependent oxidoreductase n=1 Tax=Xylophilus sp. GOD-11R TaxID=3089814 RepID=UPI00298C0E52|nr:FAD-dependent oxidoreductase [Xylophilus sp. GOD-11R]WPB58478.1 FAD-dependent oxidoreductase [Xylophilus sp. GOD-11R]
MTSRPAQLDRLQHENRFDVVVIGGGINGACLYDRLCREGYRVLLVDRGDFASGTSQASGMMIWGGLLYLRTFDIASVLRLSSDRDRIIERKAGWVTPELMRYLPPAGDRRARWLAQAGLWLYWLMSRGRRRPPRGQTVFPEAGLIRPGLVGGALAYEEAVLGESDARFVYRWIAAPPMPGQIALNYAEVQGDYAVQDRCWHLALTDVRSARTHPIRAALVVNCAGVWTDRVNAVFGIDSPWRHVLSKGVYLGLPRHAEHHASLFFELGSHQDVITHVPWGPISLWGPTETTVETIEEGRVASPEDLDFLLDHYARRYRRPFDRSDIVSVRCGIRPLVVDRHSRFDGYSLDLSRRQEVVRHADKPWISCYGGKITGCSRMAERVWREIRKSIAATGQRRVDHAAMQSRAPQVRFDGIAAPVPSPAWTAEHEMCCTLEDYLRRRTNLAQWIARGGWGPDDSNAPALTAMALEIAQGDAHAAAAMLQGYRHQVRSTLDPLLNTR